MNRRTLLEGDRLKKGTLRFLNIRILPNEGQNDYINLFHKLFEKDYAVLVRREKYIVFNSLLSYLDGRVLQGKLVEYTGLEPNGFLDLLRKERVENPEGFDNLGANHRTTFFYFIPEAHRFAILKNSSISPSAIKKYFEGATRRYLDEENILEQEIFIDIETSKDFIDIIEGAFKVLSIKSEFTYSNRDLSEKFTKIFQNKIESSGANKANVGLQAPRGGNIDVGDDSLGKAIIETAKSNGEVEARIIKMEGSSPEKVYTEDYPKEEKISYTLNSIHNVVYNKIMSLFR
ncbi:DUF4747 family protein [Dysgonomonas sp. ZJ709]|uniref:DUF4747 family protein n=1 Tax=Dysgonomonas sp. ZJ709 TaxID=2709797 RepID=UPI0013EAF278|nr:DUF4747 family protein [Dysgonomonas sp. ZJ709]